MAIKLLFIMHNYTVEALVIKYRRKIPVSLVLNQEIQSGKILLLQLNNDNTYALNDRIYYKGICFSTEH